MSDHRYQAPKGTRDFFPPDMAVRRYLERIWQTTSVHHGFDEIDGPTFEHLDLYTVKSGPGIVSELFSFTRSGGDTTYALRPEFTPTLARMVAAHKGNLTIPTKWFCMPSFFRAERPQRGRLREFAQWNVDLIGDDSASADAEIIAVAIACLKNFGLTSEQVRIRLSDRDLVGEAMSAAGVKDDDLVAAFELLDKREKLPADVFAERSAAINLDVATFEEHVQRRADIFTNPQADAPERLGELVSLLREMTLLEWCDFDLSIVRGLAYYTGMVFEVHEASGAERAIAGGGRYDGLVELFGGKPTPAVGFAMGDVVIRLVLEDRNLLPDAAALMPRADVFVVAGGNDAAQQAFRPLVAQLRDHGLHVRHSYKATRNVGKLMKDAAKARARCVVILGDELDDGNVVLKDMDGGEQDVLSFDALQPSIDELLAQSKQSDA